MTKTTEDVDEWITHLLNGDDPERPDDEAVEAWARGTASHTISAFWCRHDAETLLDAIEWVVEHDDVAAQAADGLGVPKRDAYPVLIGIEKHITAHQYRTQRWS